MIKREPTKPFSWWIKNEPVMVLVACFPLFLLVIIVIMLMNVK